MPVLEHAPTPQFVVIATKPSSTWPLQLLSTPSQLASSAAGVPAWPDSCTCPFTHAFMPVLAHAPTPQFVAIATKPSSSWPLQLLSTPSQLASFFAGVPAVQLFLTTPPTQFVAPVLAHAPTP